MRAFKTILATTCGTLIYSGAAMAQTSPASVQSDEAVKDRGQIAEIVVTAQKRSENLQNVPIAITAITSDKLSAAGINSSTELGSVTPGLTINTSGGSNILPRVRGVGQTGVTITLENPVAIYVDGVYYPSAAGGMFSLSNIEQVAVLKGPQGTLFGRNATGGLIQVTTLEPSAEFSGKADITIGNRQTVGGNFYVTGPLGEDVSADLAVHYLDQGKGFGVNRFTGVDVNKSKEFNVRSKLKVELSDRTTITLAGDYSRTDSASPPFRVDKDAIILPPNVPYPSTVGKFDVYSDVNPLSKIKQAGGSLTILQDLDFAQLTSITAYRSTDGVGKLESDMGPLRIADVSAGLHEKTFTQELQLVSSGTERFSWTLGAFYFNNRGSYGPPVEIYNGGGALRIFIESAPKVYSIAGYAQGTYALTDKLNFTAGIRYTQEKRKASGTSRLVFPAFTLVNSSTASLKDTRPTWRLSLDYRLSDQALTYLSYNRGFKSGGYNPTEIPFVAFKPEIVDAYEAGLKLDLFDRRVRINPSAYYYKYENLQVGIFQNGLLRTRNAAQATIYGLDLDMTARVSEQFTLTSGLAWIHARYDEYLQAPTYTPLPGGGNATGIGSASGNRVVNTPDWTLNVGANYTIPVGTNVLVLNATYFHSDGWFAEVENRYRQNPYDLVNLSAAFEIGEKLTLTAWGKNILNVAYGRQRSSSQSGDFVAMAAGRTFGATAGVKF